MAIVSIEQLTKVIVDSADAKELEKNLNALTDTDGFLEITTKSAEKPFRVTVQEFEMMMIEFTRVRECPTAKLVHID